MVKNVLPPAARLSASDAATLLLHAQGLLDSPERRATTATLLRAIRRLGYVQLDSINVVARAHDLILRTRFENYRPAHLRRLLEDERTLFEHWVHDAAVIPVEWGAQWQRQFRNYARERRGRMARFAGVTPRAFGALCTRVKKRIEREGPLASADFDDPRAGRAWWGWKPSKIALEYLWRTGQLAVSSRVKFQKRYELTERFLPTLHQTPPLSQPAFVDWCCREALERLGCATARELADFWGGFDARVAAAWCRKALRRESVLPVEVEARSGGAHRRAVALPDWQRRLDRAPAAPAGVRILAPFDPVLRDRARLQHLFAFDYRFEAFVPAKKRRDGYYVLPLWEGLRPIGRFDPKLERSTRTLHIRALRLEADVRVTRRRRSEIEEALDGLRRWLGAERIEHADASAKPGRQGRPGPAF